MGYAGVSSHAGAPLKPVHWILAVLLVAVGGVLAYELAGGPAPRGAGDPGALREESARPDPPPPVDTEPRRADGGPALSSPPGQGPRPPSPAEIQGQVRRAETDMEMLSNALAQHYFTNRRLPASFADMTKVDPRIGEAYLESVPDDPWGRPYVLELLGGRQFRIVSFGPDGAEGTQDDVKWPKRDGG